MENKEPLGGRMQLYRVWCYKTCCSLPPSLSLSRSLSVGQTFYNSRAAALTEVAANLAHIEAFISGVPLRR